MILKFAGLITLGAGNVLQILWDYALGGGSQTLEYPMSAGVARKLRLKPGLNSSAADCTVTVYLNGTPTALKVVIPAGNVALHTELVTQIIFAENDQLALRFECNAGGAGNFIHAAATLEYVLTTP